MTIAATTAPADVPVALERFPYTQRIQAYEMALSHGLHLVRDNFNMWAIRLSDKAHVWLCSHKSYDGLWRTTCQTFREPGFDPKNLPYMVKDGETSVKLFDPKTGKTMTIDKKNLRSRRGEGD